jgi:hypothetical protein
MKFIDVNHPCGMCMAVSREGVVFKVGKVGKVVRGGEVVCAMRNVNLQCDN